MAARLLLGSGGFRTPERVALLANEMRSFFGPIGKLLFVPYALRDHDGYVQAMIERGIHAGYALDGIHTHSDPVVAVQEAEGIFVGGGNTFRLLDTLDRLGLLQPIRDRVQSGKLPYLGVSAGTNVACPTMMTTNDMPIVQPQSFDSLGLVPFQVNAHYFSGHHFVKEGDTFVEHFGETRDERIAEYHELNDRVVLGLWEGGLLRIENGRVQLIGTRARIFRRGNSPVDVLAGSDLTEFLMV